MQSRVSKYRHNKHPAAKANRLPNLNLVNLVTDRLVNLVPNLFLQEMVPVIDQKKTRVAILPVRMTLKRLAGIIMTAWIGV